MSIYPEYLGIAEQQTLVEAVRNVAAHAPMFHPETRWGKQMSVKLTSAGQVGWVSDRRGYRYEPKHPAGKEWPEIPSCVIKIWRELVHADRLPECCLVNYYGEGARMGLHQDKDEADFTWPVLSISLGDDALFRVGNIEKGGSTESAWLKSGDVVVMGGDARLRYHGIDRIRFGSSLLLPRGGRINLTCRVVT